MTKKDVYDREIDRLTKSPQDIQNSWQSGKPLFRHCSPERAITKSMVGCLVTIRHHVHRGSNLVESRVQAADGIADKYGVQAEYDGAIRDQIAADDRLPCHESEITVEHLPVFAEWQRRLDAYYGRKPEDYD